MLKINNLPILASEMEVLTELRSQMQANGIDKLKKMKQSGNNIQITCPFHSDGQESKPSCGISLVDVKVKDKIVEAGTVHCFSCGYTASFEEFISNCFNHNDGGVFGHKWLAKNFLSLATNSRKELDLDFVRGKSNSFTLSRYISEEELSRYRYIHPYMYQRQLTDELIDKFDIGYDENFRLAKHLPKTPCITFPVRDERGNTLFVARRSVKGKLFHYPTDVDKPVYGLYELDPECEEIIVCESIFNALTCYVHGRAGVALLGTGTVSQYEKLISLPQRKIITAFDGDEAGYKATERFKKAVGPYKLVSSFVIPLKEDLNSLSYDDFENLKEIF